MQARGRHVPKVENERAKRGQCSRKPRDHFLINDPVIIVDLEAVADQDCTVDACK
jgi:hypothetical protein